MRLRETEFKQGNHLYSEYSYDGGFGRRATIYVITKVTDKSVTIMKVCEKYNCDCSDHEAERWITDSPVKTLKIKTVDEKDIYKWKLGEKYLALKEDYCTIRLWASEQFTEFSDIKDTGSDYELN